jgi:predicted transcriptional regulator
LEALATAFSACAIDGTVTTSELAEYMAMTEKTVRNRVNEHPDFQNIRGTVIHKIKGESQ